MIKNRVTVDPLTHNNFKTFDSCKRKYYYEYIKKMHWPQEESNFELGLSIHKLADYQAKGLNIDRFLSDTKPEIIETWEHLQQSDIMNYPVIESEWAFNVRINKTNYWLQGRIDRLIYDKKNNKSIILDFKTGQNIPSPKYNDWQALTYLYCIAISKNINPEDLEFWYMKTAKTPEYKKILYSEEKHKENERVIFNKINEIQSTSLWPANQNCIDNYCKYKTLCNI